MNIIEKISAITKKFVPTIIFKYIRILGTAILTPLLFSYRTGHFLSSLLNKPVNKSGKPIPWYSYPAVELLMNKNLKDKTILEWGSGHSTLWWAKEAKKVITFECDLNWYKYINKLSPSNVSLFFISDNINDAKKYIEGCKFDVIIIDGFDRFKAASFSLDFLSSDGCLILDDSQGYWGDEGEYPILDLLREKGFQRVDLFGYSAGIIQPHCTSFFFHLSCFLFSGLENPQLKFS